MKYEYFWVLMMVSLATFSIAAVVLAVGRGFKKLPNQIFALFNLAITAWAFIVGVSLWSTDANQATFLTKLYTIPVPFIALFYLYYVGNFTKRVPQFILIICSLGVLPLYLLLWKGVLVVPAVPKYGFDFMIQAGLEYKWVFVYFLGVVLIASSILIVDLRHSTGLKNQQSRYLLLGSSVGFLGGMANFWVPYNFWIYPINPYATMTIIFFVVLTGISIVKFRLMDIRIFIRRSILFISVYVGLILLASPFIFVLHKKVSGAAPLFQTYLITEIVLVGAILSAGPFLYAAFVRRSEFFQEHTMAGLTHELKSPLAAIESALDILNDRLISKPGDSDNIGYVEMIERNAVRLRKYIDNLLVVFKLPKNKAVLKMERADLRDLCERVVESFAGLAASKNIELKLFWSENAPRIIPFDTAKIELVLTNLISNAIKFTEKGTISVLAEREENRIRVTVEDTGKGIPPDETPRVFERFFQGQAGREKKGTGIGLAIAKAWVEAHGGEIRAESAGTGRGSRFWFTLPV